MIWWKLWKYSWNRMTCYHLFGWVNFSWRFWYPSVQKSNLFQALTLSFPRIAWQLFLRCSGVSCFLRFDILLLTCLVWLKRIYQDITPPKRLLTQEQIEEEMQDIIPSVKLTVRPWKSPSFLGFIPSKWWIFQPAMLVYREGNSPKFCWTNLDQAAKHLTTLMDMKPTLFSVKTILELSMTSATQRLGLGCGMPKMEGLHLKFVSWQRKSVVGSMKRLKICGRLVKSQSNNRSKSTSTFKKVACGGTLWVLMGFLCFESQIKSRRQGVATNEIWFHPSVLKGRDGLSHTNSYCKW